VRLEAETLRFQRDRAAAAEGVEEGRGVPAGRAADLRPSLLEDRLVRRVLPFDEPLDDPEEAASLVFLGLRGGEAIWVGRRVVDERREENGPAGGEGAAGPPKVERGGVAVADALLAGRLAVDGLKGKGDFDELPAGYHVTSSGRRSLPRIRCAILCARSDAFGSGFATAKKTA
jgi:hypothetical protein